MTPGLLLLLLLLHLYMLLPDVTLLVDLWPGGHLLQLHRLLPLLIPNRAPVLQSPPALLPPRLSLPQPLPQLLSIFLLTCRRLLLLLSGLRSVPAFPDGPTNLGKLLLGHRIPLLHP